MMQTASYYSTPSTPAPTAPDPLRVSVNHLLARAHNIPCTAAAQAFTALVQPNNRFQVSLDVLLPLLSGNAEAPRRILASYILYFLYSTHPVVMNPFRTAFVEVFLREREVARTEADRGGVSETEQLVWVLWKILKGDGGDLGPYSPATLASSSLPPKLRAPHLSIDESISSDEDEVYIPPSDRPQPSPIQTNGSTLHGADSNTPNSAATSSPGEVGLTKLNANGDASADQQIISLLRAACQRVLTLTEQRKVALALQHTSIHPHINAYNLPSLIESNPTLGYVATIALFKENSSASSKQPEYFDYLDALRRLPPALPSFDVMGRLVRDPTVIQDNLNGSARSVADIIRSEVLGSFLLNCMNWIEHAEQEALEGLVNDDRVAKTVQNLCRFFTALIKLDIVDPKSDLDCAEMAHFALSHANYEDANALYRVLVMGKF